MSSPSASSPIDPAQRASQRAQTSSTADAAPESTSSSSPPPATAAELRHMTSSSGLGKGHPHRASQLLQTSSARVGSRSPSSIPSSPTSVHSSSSAIFERDIEPIVCPSPSHAHVGSSPPNPHRIPRAKATEQLEQSVPSVLDSAAEVLAELELESPSSSAHHAYTSADQVSVVAPATRSGFASPMGSVRSRSPSPMARSVGSAGSMQQMHAQVLASSSPTAAAPGMSPPQVVHAHLPTQTQAPMSSPTSTSPRPNPTVNTAAHAAAAGPGSSSMSTPPSIVTPTSAYFSTASSIADSDSPPPTTTKEHAPPLPFPSQPQPYALPLFQPHPQTQQTHSPPMSAGSLGSMSSPSSHPPSPTHVATKRLSFMSYTDLLTSTPASALPLSTLTSPTSTDPPPHIPSVSGYAYAQSAAGSASAAASLRGFSLNGSEGTGVGGRAREGGGGVVGSRDSIVMLDDVGGEWEREGLGRGLEERLEALMPVSKA